MSSKLAEHPPWASPAWKDFRMEGPALTPRSLAELAGLSHRAWYPEDGHLRGNMPTACLASLRVGVVLFRGRVPGWGALSSGSADAQSKRGWRPPSRGQCFIWGSGGCSPARPPRVPHPPRPSSVHGPRDGALVHGVSPWGGARGGPGKCVLRIQACSAASGPHSCSQGESGCSDGLLKCFLVLLFIEMKLT